MRELCVCESPGARERNYQFFELSLERRITSCSGKQSVPV